MQWDGLGSEEKLALIAVEITYEDRVGSRG